MWCVRTTSSLTKWIPSSSQPSMSSKSWTQNPTPRSIFLNLTKFARRPRATQKEQQRCTIEFPSQASSIHPTILMFWKRPRSSILMRTRSRTTDSPQRPSWRTAKTSKCWGGRTCGSC
ncbi:hypothetical protein GWK47_011639 [Chionoecetes opilio]|uniref:Uncharacterized protein n=1 Tax=Chionoecetes opilio TaxID=41210 RepID=A0A8J5C2H7_CHIOP|nr:hypothetical protein GWK47_011639 [Chionoecetes opilio]